MGEVKSLVESLKMDAQEKLQIVQLIESQQKEIERLRAELKPKGTSIYPLLVAHLHTHGEINLNISDSTMRGFSTRDMLANSDIVIESLGTMRSGSQDFRLKLEGKRYVRPKTDEVDKKEY